MGNRLKPIRVNIEEYHAKITQDLILEFYHQLKFPSHTEEQLCDHRKIQDYNLQQFWDYVAKKIKDF
jgi:hypothetical protein